MARGNSVLQDEKECYITGSTYGLDCHHVMHGAFRKKADAMGLWVWLRHDIHMALHDHRDPWAGLDLELKRIAQEWYEQEHTRVDWIREFGRNYL